MNSPHTLADFVVTLSIAASTDEVNKCLVMTDDNQLKIFLIFAALPGIARMVMNESRNTTTFSVEIIDNLT